MASELVEAPDTSDRHVLVLVVGEVDIATAPSLRQAVERATHASNGRFVIDLSGVTFMDCAGLHPLLEAKTDLGERLLLRSIPDRVAELLRLTGLDAVFGIEPDDVRSAFTLAGAETVLLEEQVASQRATAGSRARIDQAKGLVMAIHGCDAEQAWRMLFRASRDQDVQVRELADALTQAVAGPGRSRPSAPLAAALKALLPPGWGTINVRPQHDPLSLRHHEPPTYEPEPQGSPEREQPLLAGNPGRPGGRPRAGDA